MAVFILGTMPLFFGIGILTSLMGQTFKAKFLKLAAIAVIYLGVSSINGALVALNSPITLQSIAENFPITIDLSGNKTSTVNNLAATQNAVIEITSSGYVPNYLRVRKGEVVNITLKTKDAFNCASAFRIPALGISKNLAPNDTQLISFVPTQPGQLQFNCSMGMYRGIIEVI